MTLRGWRLLNRWHWVHVLGWRRRLLLLRRDVLRRDNHTQNTERPYGAHCESIRNHEPPGLARSLFDPA
jgi:hypothetical protein